jgi:hypothetical protein
MKKLLTIIPLVFLLCFVFSCQDREAMAELEEFRAQADVEEQNIKVIQRIIEEGNKNKNLDVLSEVCTQDYKFYFPSNATPISLAQHLELGRAFYIPFPDLFHKIEEIYAVGNIVVARLTLSGTHEAEFQGFPQQGKKLNGRQLIFIDSLRAK